MSQPASTPNWATSGTLVEPSSGKKAAGWVTGEPAPAQWLNWWMNLVYLWVVYLKNLTSEALTWTAVHVFQAAVTFNAPVTLTDTLTVAGTATVAQVAFSNLVSDSAQLVAVPDAASATKQRLLLSGFGIKFYLTGSGGGTPVFTVAFAATFDNTAENWTGTTSSRLVTLSAGQIALYTPASVASGVITWSIRLDALPPTGAIRQAHNDSGASPGAATHYAQNGRAALASGTASVTITNALCTTNSTVNITVEGSSFDATATRYQVAVASGSFTLHSNANATSAVVFRYHIHTGNGTVATP